MSIKPGVFRGTGTGHQLQLVAGCAEGPAVPELVLWGEVSGTVPGRANKFSVVAYREKARDSGMFL